MRRTDSLEKTDAGKDWGWMKRVVEDEMVRYHWLNGHESEQLQKIVKDREAWICSSQSAGRDLATEQQQQKPATIHFPITKMKNTHEIGWHNI